MCEQVAVEGRVLFEQRFQIERSLRRDELIQAHLMWGDRRPLLLYIAVIRIRAHIPNTLENHCVTVVPTARAPPVAIVTIWPMTQPDAPEAAEVSAEVQQIVKGYTFDEPAIELGVVVENDARCRPRASGSRSAC